MSKCGSQVATEVDPLTTRGVQNPRVIDLIRDELTPVAAVVLVMMEQRSWSDAPDRLEQLGAKCNNYLDYVLDGWLYSQHPQYQGRVVVIELLSKETLSGSSARLFEQFKTFVSPQGIICRAAVDETLCLTPELPIS